MDEDYRNTPYCPKLHNIKAKKEKIKRAILGDNKKSQRYAYLYIKE